MQTGSTSYTRSSQTRQPPRRRDRTTEHLIARRHELEQAIAAGRAFVNRLELAGGGPEYAEARRLVLELDRRWSAMNGRLSR